MKIYAYYLLLCSLLLATSCTKKFDEINADPNSPKITDPGFLLVSAEKKGMDNLWNEYNNGRGGLHYAQYWSATTYSNESRYQIREIQNSNYWNVLYAGTLKDLNEIIKINREKNFDHSQNQIAIAEILKVWAFQILTDTYEDVPYKLAMGGLDRPNSPYDKSIDIYTDLLKVLGEQVTKLAPTKKSFPAQTDIIYNGDVNKWRLFANSLRLRVAMRVSDVPALKTQVEKAIRDAVADGVFTSNADNAIFRYIEAPPNNNVLNESYKSRIDFCMSKTMVDFMLEINDPRLPVYAAPAKNSGEYIGKPYGLNQKNGEKIPLEDVSQPGSAVLKATAPGVYMDYAEVEFILAEAVARGILPGSAEEHYKKGIRASLEDRGITGSAVDQYLTRVPYNGGQWKDVIGTQKWLALYMQGMQGWFERLRLDFKKPSGQPLFIAPVDGSLDRDVTVVPTRMTYPVEEQQLNKANYDQALQSIGGRDSKAGRHFWDLR
ncbi:SusD/RagB family nutrient-binding outer membrane lipoprotein [Chitinophaga nivalis]|uniref:SusD/RagB family nutrient-binding outer membrane lipoprotein n=1 Tax=Chitinophaga nivalis TaxID=2991709 RepID=A0ABT3IMK8_9BACT|nr:SusD/RagB family nutrient-binding outer membrane lipoprotein [Chitinophaga nivalis]MCW3465096.1 SusD/RagB family nutrient-binding outer membrane lipoprotein [Chitinophaga nivalis]MCW3485212.1 SusD/RagB family nutrient-binding outer membrane lipoprotein [Chitinophaga nivalis]